MKACNLANNGIIPIRRTWSKWHRNDCRSLKSKASSTSSRRWSFCRKKTGLAHRINVWSPWKGKKVKAENQDLVFIHGSQVTIAVWSAQFFFENQRDHVQPILQFWSAFPKRTASFGSAQVVYKMNTVAKIQRTDAVDPVFWTMFLLRQNDAQHHRESTSLLTVLIRRCWNDWWIASCLQSNTFYFKWICLTAVTVVWAPNSQSEIHVGFFRHMLTAHVLPWWTCECEVWCKSYNRQTRNYKRRSVFLGEIADKITYLLDASPVVSDMLEASHHFG